MNTTAASHSALPPGYIKGRTLVIGAALVVIPLVTLTVTSTILGNRRKVDAQKALLFVQSDDVRRTITTTPQGVIELVTPLTIGDQSDAKEISIGMKELLLLRRNMGDFRVGETKDLAGREILENGIDGLVVEETQLPDGPALTISSKDSELVTALHAWAADQNSP
jgi:hypothetical protein